jgi:threonine dehydrogenase-like Zn-dependent dehydrogenase
LKAIAIYPDSGKLALIDQPEPKINASDEILVQILQVGICGTDREEARGGRADAPAGEAYLVIGHEMFGRVVSVGKDVSKVKPDDFAVFTVRRGCGKCQPCLMGRPDMCQTGDYKERGIKELNGYQSTFVVDQEAYLIRVPPALSEVGVLTEPLSVAEKAIDEVMKIQQVRLPGAADLSNWWQTRRCLVAGLGPIGLLAAVALRLRGAQVYGLDIVDQDSPRPQFLAAIGGKYIDGRKIPANQVDSQIGQMEFIFESTGVAALEFNLLDALGPSGIYVLTGIPGGDRPLEIPGAELIRQLVLDNQIMIGSVNASLRHFQMAVDDLGRAEDRWAGLTQKLITQRYPFTSYERALLEHPEDEIKTVVEWEDKL